MTTEVGLTIAASELPVMRQVPRDAVAKLYPGVEFWFDAPDEKKPETFRTLRIQWPDGVDLFLDEVGVSCLVTLLHEMQSGYIVMELLHEEANALSHVYRVIE